MAGERVSDGGWSGLSGGLDSELGQAVGSERPWGYVVVFLGDVPQQVYALKARSAIIGRAPEVDVRIIDASVSSHHASIRHETEQFEIVDENSTNGTLVNGKRTVRSPLRNADRVTVGNIDFIFLLERPTMATIRLPDRVGRPSPAIAIVPAPPLAARVNSNEEEGLSLEDLVRKLVAAYRFVRARAVFLVSLALFGALLGVSSLFVLPPGVVATTEVRLLPHLTLSNNPGDDPWQNGGRDSSQFVEKSARTLGQSDVISASYRKLTGLTPPDSLIASIASRLKTDETGDHTFRVSFKDKMSTQPAAAEFLAVQMQNYVRSSIAESLRELAAKVDFLRGQSKFAELEVKRISAERAAFREANADHLPENSQAGNTRFELESRRDELSSQLHQLSGDLMAEESQLQTHRPDAERKFQWSQMYTQSLTDTNRKLTEAYARGLGDAHPEVLALKNEKQRLEVLAKEELQSPTSELARQSDPNYLQAQRSVSKLRAQIAAARSNLAETQRSLNSVQRVERQLPRVEQKLADLNHQEEAALRVDTDLSSKLKQAKIQLDLEQVSAESRYEVAPVHLERARSLPTLGKRGGFGLFIGLLIAGLAIAAREAKKFVSRTISEQPVVVPEVLARRSRPSDRRF
ncbi:MAG TPA: FHA domain-containing protein [Polyangia bacterium]|nr:FHA domain-containing protein [Polyangia bacterium]